MIQNQQHKPFLILVFGVARPDGTAHHVAWRIYRPSMYFQLLWNKLTSFIGRKKAELYIVSIFVGGQLAVLLT